MEQHIQDLLVDLNQAVIQFRGLYSFWSKQHGLSYNEMLVFYTIRNSGFCTQKQICEDYLLPRQTINHVIAGLKKEGLLAVSQEHCAGREKAFVLTEKGKAYAKPVTDVLAEIETASVERMGAETLRTMMRMVADYNQTLQKCIEEKL